MAEFHPGQTLTRTDLALFLADDDDNPTNAYEISYAIYYVDPTPPETEVLIGSANRTPVNPTTGEYWAALMVPPSADIGTYRIRWTFRQYAGGPESTVTEEFEVVALDSLTQVTYNNAESAMLRSLRIFLRDQNPDRFYHFRPPEQEGRIGRYDKVFGRIWEEEELYEYLLRALDWWNASAPVTGVGNLQQLVQSKPEWRTFVIHAAMFYACNALALNWIADQFSYSIGGVSLDINKASEYSSMAQSLASEMDKAKETKKETVKFIRGLQQPRFGMGVRSAFGPHVGRGILSPRSFVG